MDPIIEAILKLVNAQGGVLTLSLFVNVYLFRQWRRSEKANVDRIQRELANAIQQLGRTKSRTEAGTIKTLTHEECQAHQEKILEEKANGGKKSKKKLLGEALEHVWAQIHELESGNGNGGVVESQS